MKRILFAACCAGLFVAGLTSQGEAAGAGSLYGRCVRCHGEDGSKTPHVLKGQQPDELVAKLRGYAAGTYGGSRKAVMTGVAKSLNDADMQALAAHIGTF